MLSKGNSKVRAVSIAIIAMISCILRGYNSYPLNPHMIRIYPNMVRLGDRRNILVLCLWDNI